MSLPSMPGPLTPEQIAAVLCLQQRARAEGRREGAERMRERAAEACETRRVGYRCRACDPTVCACTCDRDDAADFTASQLAEAIRALPVGEP